jgi:quercetin dioxygenase-like cupin family protein
VGASAGTAARGIFGAEVTQMQTDPVDNVRDRGWQDAKLPGARGYESMEIVADDPDYTSAYSLEYLRLGAGDESRPHVEAWNHLLFFLEGSGEITIGDRTWPIRPGSYAKVKAGARHSVRNLGDTDMLLLAIYDPPRVRRPAAAA